MLSWSSVLIIVHSGQSCLGFIGIGEHWEVEISYTMCFTLDNRRFINNIQQDHTWSPWYCVDASHAPSPTWGSCHWWPGLPSGPRCIASAVSCHEEAADPSWIRQLPVESIPAKRTWESQPQLELRPPRNWIIGDDLLMTKSSKAWPLTQIVHDHNDHDNKPSLTLINLN